MNLTNSIQKTYEEFTLDDSEVTYYWKALLHFATPNLYLNQVTCHDLSSIPLYSSYLSPQVLFTTESPLKLTELPENKWAKFPVEGTDSTVAYHVLSRL